jgi:catechol 2,3-dioxygenase-like lactoylglutathione lyase family enzyme
VELRAGGVVDHLWMRVADVGASQQFYELVGRHAAFRLRERGDRAQFLPLAGRGTFSLVAGTPTRNAHVAFPAEANGVVDAFHRDLTAAGYRDNGRPGERRAYHPEYYGAFVLDPDGNNVELVNHNR